MSKDEALDLALEALEKSARNWPSDSVIQAITAIKQARSAPVQEPDVSQEQKGIFPDYAESVGCMRCATPKKCASWGCSPNTWPSETTPPAAPVQEPVAYPEGDVVGPCICESWPGGKCLKCPRTTSPAAQRQWVGLTDEEYFEIGQRHWVTSTKIELIHAEIEAKLKEKNT